MAKRDKTGKSKGGLGGWLVRKLLKSPAAWLGAVLGLAAGIPIAGVSGPVAGICMGGLIGAAVMGLTHAIYMAVWAARSIEDTKEMEALRTHLEEREETLLEKLKTIGLDADADVLMKLNEARDSIFKRCESPDVSAEISAPTLELVSQIAGSALHRSEELLDLTRRIQDPLLDSPQDAEDKAAACRADLVRAYQAVADSRSRILLHKEPSTDALLDQPGVGEKLVTLSQQLDEETKVLQGIDRRLRGLDMGPEISPAGSQDTTATTYSSERESD